ncbi:MAG: flippase-like domain-containing protein, partial [Bacilli bacterium]|nr:flippase-like domain-containing protein [Bacilli bacterium]
MDKETVKVSAPKSKKKSAIRRYAIYITLVLTVTSISLFLTLRGHSSDIAQAFSNCDWRWIGIIAGVMFFAIFIDGLVITVFMRLYTRKYHLHQGTAVSLIGTFYGGITPGTKGGQVMQAYTLKKQGSQISNAASLLVMYFILYHVALIIFDIVTVIFKAGLMTSVSIEGHFGSWYFKLPLAPLTIIGFVVNISIIGLLLVMSYSHKVHNFIMHYGIGLLARLHILKNPDQSRESLRIQVENFKIELRRLLSNVRVTLLILVLLTIGLICKFSIPWFAGMALKAFDSSTTGGLTVNAFFDACFMSSYHQMITGLFPIPGGAGVSELFFGSLFDTFYVGGASGIYMSSALLIWRSSTYYVLVLVAGVVTMLYRASPKEESLTVDQKAFVTMQFETYEERKRSSDTLYETTQMSRKELQNRLKEVLTINRLKKKEEEKKSQDYHLDDTD